MRRYLITFAIAFFPVLLLGLVTSAFRSDDIRIMKRILQSPNQAIFVLGNSIIDHVSICDTDKRTIPQLLREQLIVDVVDLSKGGMQLNEYNDIVNLLGARYDKATLVIPLVPDMSDPAYWHRAQDIYRHILYSVAAMRFPQRVSDLIPINRPDNVDDMALNYMGKSFGTTKMIQSKFMVREKSERKCPEQDAIDETFFRFMHWRQARRSLPSERFAADLKQLNTKARELGWPIIFVLLPVNTEGFLQTSDDGVMNNLNETHNWMRKQLQEMGAEFADLTYELDAAAFADRWCACGHLAEAGRRNVANTIASRISLVK